jgi:hypothetical protein
LWPPSGRRGFAALPLPDVDGALAELAYADDVLKLGGVVLFSIANAVYLGDARFEPLFEELERVRSFSFIRRTWREVPRARQYIRQPWNCGPAARALSG